MSAHLFSLTLTMWEMCLVIRYDIFKRLLTYINTVTVTCKTVSLQIPFLRK